MLSFATLSRPSGAMAPRLPRTVSTSVQVVAVKPRVRTTPTTALILECFFIRMSPTSTHRFHTQVVNATVRDATYVLDGLLYHESDLRIEEHYTDTMGFTDHVFALMHLLGFRFAPRIWDLTDRRLYVPKDHKHYTALAGLIGGTLSQKLTTAHWEEILRLVASIKQGTVSASLMLRKLWKLTC